MFQKYEKLVFVMLLLESNISILHWILFVTFSTKKKLKLLTKFYRQICFIR